MNKLLKYITISKYIYKRFAMFEKGMEEVSKIFPVVNYKSKKLCKNCCGVVYSECYYREYSELNRIDPATGEKEVKYLSVDDVVIRDCSLNAKELRSFKIKYLLNADLNCKYYKETRLFYRLINTQTQKKIKNILMLNCWKFCKK